MKDSDYSKDINIDEGALNEEWERQASLYVHYSIKVASAERKRNKAKEKLDVTKAELDRDIRKNPADFGLEKITDTPVANCILTQDEYKEAHEELIETSYELSVLQGVLRAFDHKKKALENLVSLHIAGYSAEPRKRRERPRRGEDDS